MFFSDNEDLVTECYFKKNGVWGCLWNDMTWDDLMCVCFQIGFLWMLKFIHTHIQSECTVDGRNPSGYGKYPIIYKVLYIPGGAGFLPSNVSCQACEVYDCSKSCSTLIVPALVGQDAVISSRNDQEAFCAISRIWNFTQPKIGWPAYPPWICVYGVLYFLPVKSSSCGKVNTEKMCSKHQQGQLCFTILRQWFKWTQHNSRWWFQFCF